MQENTWLRFKNSKYFTQKSFIRPTIKIFDFQFVITFFFLLCVFSDENQTLTSYE